MNQMQTIANTDLAKEYLSKRKIPDLFEVNTYYSIDSSRKYINIILGLNVRSYGP